MEQRRNTRIRQRIGNSPANSTTDAHKIFSHLKPQSTFDDGKGKTQRATNDWFEARPNASNSYSNQQMDKDSSKPDAQENQKMEKITN